MIPNHKDWRAFGLLFGLTALVLYLMPAMQWDVEMARQQGMISDSILNKVSMIQIFLNYAFIVIVPGFGVALYAWHQKSFTRLLLRDTNAQVPCDRWWMTLMVMSLGAFLYVYPDFLYINMPGGNPFQLYFETGAYLRVIQAMLQHQDVSYVYGILNLLPVVGLMHLWGSKLIVFTVYIAFLNLLGFYLIYTLLQRQVAFRPLRWYVLVAMFVLLFPFKATFHSSLIRYTIACLPLLFVYQYMHTKHFYYLICVGIGLVLIKFFASERANVALLAVLVMGFFYVSGQNNSRWRLVGKTVLSLLVGGLGAGLFLGLCHVLGWIEWTWLWPKVDVNGAAFWGHNCLAYPTISLLKAKGLAPLAIVKKIFVYYSPHVVMSLSGFMLMWRWIHGPRNVRLILTIGLWVVALLSFIHLLYRAGMESLLLDGIPLMIVVAALLDDVLSLLKTSWRRYLALAVCMIVSVSVYRGLGQRAVSVSYLKKSIGSGMNRWGKPELMGGEAYVQSRRAKGFVLNEAYAQELDYVVAYLQKHTLSDEKIYLFGNVPLLSFLADRPFMLKNHISPYNIVNARDEQRVIDIARRQAPELIVIQWDMEVDGLTPEDKFPRLWAYVHQNYVHDKMYQPIDEGFIDVLRLKKEV